MAVSTPFARAYLRTAWTDAQAAGITLEAKLDALVASTVAQVSSGRSVISTHGNGRRVDFQVAEGSSKNPSAGVSPSDLVELTSKLRDLFDASLAAGNSDDDTHFAWIMSQLKARRSSRSDYRLLRSSKLDLFPIYPFYR